ncbi:hypothetical protein BHM03_00035085 [Ensete ventricosum]|nr:hypothetical protein BHM03_00035085 [Ensete ventricosum]
MVFSPIAFQPDLMMPDPEQGAEQEPNITVPTRGFAGLKVSISESIKRIFCPNEVSLFLWSCQKLSDAQCNLMFSAFTVWDISQVWVLVDIHLKVYFNILCSDGTFYLWETNTWTSEPWSSTSGYVTGATWDPEGRMILISFSESVTLGSIHFASRPPSLGM